MNARFQAREQQAKLALTALAAHLSANPAEDITPKIANYDGNPIILPPGNYVSTVAPTSGVKIHGSGKALNGWGSSAPLPSACTLSIPPMVPPDDGSMLTDIELDGLCLTSQLVMDRLTHSKIDVAVFNLTINDWAVKNITTAAAIDPDCDNFGNEIKVLIVGCQMGMWNGSSSPSSPGSNCCHNKFDIETWAIAGVSLHLGDCDNEHFKRILVSSDIEIDVLKARSYTTEHIECGGAFRFVNTGTGIQRGSLIGYDQDNGEPLPVCDTAVPFTNFCGLITSKMQQYGIINGSAPTPAPTPTPSPTATMSVDAATQTVSWSAPQASKVTVDVVGSDGVNKTWVSNEPATGSASAVWIVPGNPLTFTLYGFDSKGNPLGVLVTASFGG